MIKPVPCIVLESHNQSVSRKGTLGEGLNDESNCIVIISQLRFRASREQSWGMQLERIIGSRQEYAEWAFTPKREFSGVQRYGHLVGLNGVRSGKRLELLPYVVGRGEYADPGPDPFRSDAEHSATTGAGTVTRRPPSMAVR